jgi:signal transduction histidine kinase
MRPGPARLTDVEGRCRTEVVGPLVRLLLDVRAVTLLVTSVAVLDGWRSAALVVLMAATSIGPLLAWTRIGPWVLRHPAAVAADLAVLVVLFAAAGSSTVIGVYALTTATLAGILYGRAGGLALAAPVVVAALAAVTPVPQEWGPALLIPVLLPGAALLGAELRRLLDERADAQHEAHAVLVRAATAEERARLAREMHDSLLKTLHGVALSAACLEELVVNDPDRARSEIGALAERASAATELTRLMLDGLRSDDLDRSFADAVATEADRLRARGIAVSVDVDPDIDPDPDVRWELLQVISESLTNVERHARAGAVAVLVLRVRGHVEVHVIDDGRGMSTPAVSDLLAHGHYGLAGISERARRLQGTAMVDSSVGAGTAVSVSIPDRVLAGVSA